MAEKKSPWLNSSYGWNLGESGWNDGMDENLNKFSVHIDKNIDGIVSTLPPGSEGKAYFLTSDNRLYYYYNGAFSSSPVPKWSIFNDRATGQSYQFNGTNLLPVEDVSEVQQELSEFINTLSSPTGARNIGSGITVVDSVASLRLLDNTSPSTTVITLGYYAGSRRGWSIYTLDPSDLISPDDGGSVIVANDGARWKSLATKVHVDNFGAKGDGITDDRASIQNSLDFAYGSGKGVVYLGIGLYAIDTAPSATYSLLNRGVSIIGENTIKSSIVPKSTMSNGTDFLQIQPEAGVEISFLEFKNFIIYPGADGTKRGKRAIVVNMNNVSNASSLIFDGVYCAPGNDISLEWITNSTNNPQGGPANSVFSRSHFWEGIRLVNHGDSISFENVVFRSTQGSGRPGLSTEGVSAGGGQPAQLNISECNFDCDGGALIAKNGLSLKFLNNNVEQSHGTGSGSSAVVDIEGTANTSAYVEIKGNNFGVFGTADIGQVVRLNNSIGSKVGDNRFLSGGSGFADRAILITSSCTDIEISPTNEIDPTFPEAILDSGVGTRGLPKLLTPLNGFGNAVGDQPLVASKNPDGSVWVAGSMTCPASASGQVFGNIPLGWRYLYRQRIPITVIAASAYRSGVVVIETNGDLVFFSDAASPTSFQFNVTFGGVGFVLGNT